ncbi:MAG: CoA transferase, partial [Hyphomicrobiales bacterium]|nr:CoA transferase [Hyphomicrobiales bacterium]
MSAPSPKNVLAGLLRAAGQADATAGAIELPETAPVLPSSFAVDAAAQATIAAAALAA